LKDLGNVPEQFKPLYAPTDDGGFALSNDATVAGAVEALLGMQKALNAARAEAKEAKGKAVDLGPLSEWGNDPATIAAAFKAKADEMTGQIAKGKGAELDLGKLKEAMGSAHAKELQAKDSAIANLEKQIHRELVTNKATTAILAAKGNPQLRTYALGALLANKKLDVERVTVTIVQPRAGHPDGRIRSETFHVIDLMDWTQDMLAAMRRSREALDAKATMPEAAWAATYLSPGGHCRDTFCKAQATCPALRQAALDAVGVHFSPIDDTPMIANSPDSGSPEERAKRLDMLDMIEAWIKEVRAHEHRMAEMGQPAPGYALVEKTGREKWVDEEAARAAIAATGLAEEKWVNPGKLRTPKQVREALKKAKADASALAGLSETPSGGTNLVRIDQTTRTVKPAVEQHFTAIKE
jgi:hypothetical protein